MNKFFLEEKRAVSSPRCSRAQRKDLLVLQESASDRPDLGCPGRRVRQRHIDQAQSVNLYITTDYSLRDLLNLMILAWEKGVKTLYYVRSQSLEVEECESCSA